MGSDFLFLSGKQIFRKGAGSKLAQKIKKQHTVPQCYLNAWCAPGKKQTHVFDKVSEQKRISNIEDIASERYFYDIDLEAFRLGDYVEGCRDIEMAINDEGDPQVIEHSLSEDVEGPFSKLLNKLRKKVAELTPWHINNCFFISKEEKDALSECLAVQFLRAKGVRNGISDAADCMVQLMREWGVEASELERLAESKEQIKNIHISMMLDPDNLLQTKAYFQRLTWMLVVNKTKKKLYTCDSPIATIAHKHDAIRSMNGIASPGVEVFLPISPDAVLVMVDAMCLIQYLPFERRYYEITNSTYVDHYNSVLAERASRFIVSIDGEFTLLDGLKQEQPNFFKQPHSELIYGDKTFCPSRNGFGSGNN